MAARLYVYQRIPFEKIQFSEDTDRVFEDELQKGKTGHVNNKDLEKIKHDQRHETGRLKHARTRTEENVITVDELVGLLRQEG